MSSFIHLLVWSLSPLLDVRPGTTRGMFGDLVGVWYDFVVRDVFGG